jgi:hypothetical protein
MDGVEQQPQGIVSHVYHDVGFEVSKVVSLESGESVSGSQRASGQQAVVLVLHPTLSPTEKYTFHFGWEPWVARRLGELLIEQADLIERG